MWRARSPSTSRPVPATPSKGGGGIASGVVDPSHTRSPRHAHPRLTRSGNTAMAVGRRHREPAGTFTMNFRQVNGNSIGGWGRRLASGNGDGRRPGTGSSTLNLFFSQLNGNTSTGGPTAGAGGMPRRSQRSTSARNGNSALVGRRWYPDSRCDAPSISARSSTTRCPVAKVPAVVSPPSSMPRLRRADRHPQPAPTSAPRGGEGIANVNAGSPQHRHADDQRQPGQQQRSVLVVSVADLPGRDRSGNPAADGRW